MTGFEKEKVLSILRRAKLHVKCAPGDVRDDADAVRELKRAAATVEFDFTYRQPVDLTEFVCGR